MVVDVSKIADVTAGFSNIATLPGLNHFGWNL